MMPTDGKSGRPCLSRLNGTRSIAADTVLRLGRYFNTTPQSWLDLQKNCELEMAKRTAGQAIASEVSPRAA